MVPTTFAGLSKSLNQRFFLVTLARVTEPMPPAGASEASQTEESLDSEAYDLGQRGETQA